MCRVNGSLRENTDYPFAEYRSADSASFIKSKTRRPCFERCPWIGAFGQFEFGTFSLPFRRAARLWLAFFDSRRRRRELPDDADAWKWDRILDISVYYITGGTGMFMKVLLFGWLGFRRGLSVLSAPESKTNQFYGLAHSIRSFLFILYTLLD